MLFLWKHCRRHPVIYKYDTSHVAVNSVSLHTNGTIKVVFKTARQIQFIDSDDCAGSLMVTLGHVRPRDTNIGQARLMAVPVKQAVMRSLVH